MNKLKPKVLIIDDNEDVLLAAKLLLKPHAMLIHTETDPNIIPSILKDEKYDVIYLDMNFSQDMTSGQEGFHWLKEIMKIDPTAVVILITAYGDIEMAVRAVKEGATDFVLKPWQNEKFLATFHSAVRLRESRIEIENLRSRQIQLSKDLDNKFHDIVGVSKAMQDVFSTIDKVAKTDANVLILGENGTGKELIARALHRQSNRSSEVFLSVDMGAISRSLFESELFGHVRGAFTDAKENKSGRFELASGGTLFLDEIGNISTELQAKLLTVLQNRQVFRVGSGSAISIDIRLICATNEDIYKKVNNGQFRQDLLYRINTVEIHLAPLRERKEDIPILAEHFLGQYRKKYIKKDLNFSADTIKKLENYDWPGNVRELQHSIERAIILCDSNTLNPSDFPFSAREETKDNFSMGTHNIEEMEKNLIRKIMLKYDGNVTKAAKELGITRTSLYRRIDKYGL